MCITQFSIGHNMDYKKLYAMKQNQIKRLLKINENLNNNAGIYFLTREEKGIRYAYIGQAKHLMDRLVSHLNGYSHIDLSIKKRGFYDIDKNENGWHLNYLNFAETELDEKERYYISAYANKGYQMYNKTIGGQDTEKSGLGEGKSTKGYQEGLHNGYEKCKKEIKELFEKYLVAEIKEKPNKIKERKLKEFKEWLEND